MEFTEEDLAKVAQYILDGLTPDEACVLAGFLPKDLKEAMAKDIRIKTFIEQQQIKYKHEHLKKINERKDPKSSMWILEKTMPEQFGSSRRNVEPLDVFGAIIREIQKRDDNIITIEAGGVGGREPLALEEPKRGKKKSKARSGISGILD